jgi:hypothetical protein
MLDGFTIKGEARCLLVCKCICVVLCYVDADTSYWRSIHGVLDSKIYQVLVSSP